MIFVHIYSGTQYLQFIDVIDIIEYIVNPIHLTE